MGIKKIILNNWKSYSGNFEIPVFKFSAIIGPNGAGKSNLMDAISFVLGVGSNKLRGKRLSEHINKVDQSHKFASVELVFEKSIKGSTEIILLKRVVKVNGNSSYILNGKTVKWDVYDKKLKSLGILCKSRNFLVFQGDISAVASKSPRELTAMIEEVSGSSELVNDYEKALLAKKNAEQKLAKKLDIRKGILKEKRQILEQKTEAENYQQMLEKLSKTKEEFYKTQYENYEMEIEDIKVKSKKAKNISKIERELSNVKNDLSIAKKNKVKNQEEIEDKTEIFGALKEKIDFINMDRKQKKEESEEIEKNVKRIEKSIKTLNDAIAIRDNIVSDIYGKLNIANKDIENFNLELNERNSNLDLDEEKKNEFFKLERTFEIKKRVELTELNLAQFRLEEFRENIKNTLEKKSALDQRKKSYENSVEQKQKNLNELVQSVKEFESKIKKLKIELDVYEEEDNIKNAKRKSLKARHLKKLEKLQNLEFNRTLTQRDRKRLENYHYLRDRFGNCIKGFVVDLLKPISPKFRIPVLAALGFYNADAIVVDSKETGLRCIQALKERRLGTATFFPMDSLRLKPLKTRNREIGKNVKLMVDVVNCKEEFKSLANFVFGSSVYCETLEIARDVCFRREDYRNKVKAITREGTVISKNGNMTGGKASMFKDQLMRFNEQEVIEVQKKIKEIEKELESLGEENNQILREKEELYDTMTKKKNWLKIEIKAVEKVLAKEKSKISVITKENNEIDKILKENDRLKNKMETDEKRWKKEVDKLKKEHFKIYISENGIKDLSLFICQLKGFTAEMSKRKAELYERRDSLKEKLEFEKNKTYYREYQQKKSDMESGKEKLKQLEKELKNSTDQSEDLNKKIQKSKRSIELKQKLERKLNEQILSFGKESEVLEKRVKNAEKLKGDTEAEKERLETLKNDIFMHAQLDEIDLRKIQEPGKRESFEARSKSIKELEKEIKTQEKEIAATCPNLRSFDQFKALERKSKASGKDFQEAKDECQTKTKKFKAVEKKRSELFLKAFNHIENAINSIYKQMTESDEFPMGGNAYLTLESNNAQPFAYGTIFNAMPPSKRFREIESLSGGEKSVAALALLFAIHSFHPVPFFVLDEIDAALDSSNVAKVVRYIERKTRIENFQCIVISLKDSFYHRADELIGVYQDTDKGSSGILTLDLAGRFAADQLIETHSIRDESVGSSIPRRSDSRALSVSSLESDNALS